MVYLPQGATSHIKNGTSYFKYAGVSYRPYYSGGEVVYIVNG